MEFQESSNTHEWYLVPSRAAFACVVEHLSGRSGRSSRDQAVATRPAAEGQCQLPSGRLLFPNRLCLDSPSPLLDPSHGRGPGVSGGPSDCGTTLGSGGYSSRLRTTSPGTLGCLRPFQEFRLFLGLRSRGPHPRCTPKPEYCPPRQTYGRLPQLAEPIRDAIPQPALAGPGRCGQLSVSKSRDCYELH